MALVDLCVVNYNTERFLKRLVECLLQDAEDPIHSWQLYIADNGSTDGSVDYLKLLSAKGIAETYQNSNIGYGKACNQLVSKGSSPIVALLNADVWMSTADTVNMAKAFNKLDFAVLGPKQRNEQGSIVHAGIIGTNENPKFRAWRSPDPQDRLYRDIIECVTIMGAAYFMRRSVWDEMTNCSIWQRSLANMNIDPQYHGAFLPTPHYYDETWNSYHCRAHEYKIGYYGHVSIGHTWHASSEVGGEADQQFEPSRKIFRQACADHNILCD